MKIEILQENLIKGINIVSRIIPPRPQIPALGNVLLTADNLGLHLQAGDGEITVKTFVGAKVIEEGSVCVPSKLFGELVSSLSSGKLELHLDKDILRIISDSFKGKVNCQSVEDYPIFQVKEPLTSISFDSNRLKESFSKVAFSTAIDASRPALTGVLFRKTDFGWQLVATDAFRLSLVNLTVESNPFGDLIVPAKVLSEVLRIIPDAHEEKIQILFFDQEVGFKFSQTEVYSRVIAGNYPAFEKIIPSESKYKISIIKSVFEKAVKTAAIFARDNSNIIKIKLVPELEILTVLSSSSTGEQEQEIETKVIAPLDEEIVIAFNFRYLLEFLSVLNTEEIVLEINGSLSPVVFKNPLDENFLHLIMPVRLQS